jgi:hypothetical protein
MPDTLRIKTGAGERSVDRDRMKDLARRLKSARDAGESDPVALFAGAGLGTLGEPVPADLEPDPGVPGPGEDSDA